MMIGIHSVAIARFWIVCLTLAPGCAGSTAGRTTALPVAVTCKLYWRATSTLGQGDSPNDPKFQLQERIVRVDRDKEATAQLADVNLSVGYSVDEFEGSSVSVQAAFDNKPLVSWLYQLSTSVRNQFVGPHGFTGLVYLTHPTKGGDYQFMCEVVNP